MVKQVRGNGVFSRLRSDDEAELGNDSFELLQNGLDFVEEWNVVVDVRKHHPLTLKFHKKKQRCSCLNLKNIFKVFRFNSPQRPSWR